MRVVPTDDSRRRHHRARRPPRRPRLLSRDLSRRPIPRARHRRAVRAGQPLAIGRRHAARPAPAAPASAGQADSRHRGRDLRRRRRRAPRLADVRPLGRRHAVGRELQAVSTCRPASRTASASSARSRRSSTSARTSTIRRARSASPGTTRRSALPGRSREPLLSARDTRHPTLADVTDRLPVYADRICKIAPTKSSVRAARRLAPDLPVFRRKQPGTPLALRQGQVRWSDYGRAP